MSTRSQEISARTVDEAIQHGLDQLDVALDEVEVVVLDRGRPGILGIGAGPARVRLTVRSHEDGASVAREIVQTILRAMEIDPSVYIVSPSGDLPISIDIRGEDAGILIGHQGRTLADLQSLVNILASRRLGQWTPITLDVEGYKMRRFERVRQLALRTAQRVQHHGQPIALEPMGAAERRVVHMALSDHPAVTTQSDGTGASRQVTIYPR